jgi:hypothetical protein
MHKKWHEDMFFHILFSTSCNFSHPAADNNNPKPLTMVMQAYIDCVSFLLEFGGNNSDIWPWSSYCVDVEVLINQIILVS